MDPTDLLFILSTSSALVVIVFAFRHWRKKAHAKLRRRVAQDIHDDLGHSLSNICMWSGLVSNAIKGVGEMDRTQEYLDKISAEATRVQDAVTDCIAVLDKSCSTLGHIAALLNRHGHEILPEKGIAFSLELPEALKAVKIPASVRGDIYLIIKEGLHNIMKHSSASRVHVSFAADFTRLYCRISDDGCGFDVDKEHMGRGLSNMQRRAELIGGKLDIRSHPGEGCTLTLTATLRSFWYPRWLFGSANGKMRKVASLVPVGEASPEKAAESRIMA